MNIYCCLATKCVILLACFEILFMCYPFSPHVYPLVLESVCYTLGTTLSSPIPVSMGTNHHLMNDFMCYQVFELGWDWDDLQLLAQGSLAGHLLECGCQLTGGYYMHPGDDLLQPQMV